MKYSDHPMPLKEGETPWAMVLRPNPKTGEMEKVWIQPEDDDWIPEPLPQTEMYEVRDADEFYDQPTRCKSCGTEFIAYNDNELTRNYCPGCGTRLVKGDQDGTVRD